MRCTSMTLWKPHSKTGQSQSDVVTSPVRQTPPGGWHDEGGDSCLKLGAWWWWNLGVKWKTQTKKRGFLRFWKNTALNLEPAAKIQRNKRVDFWSEFSCQGWNCCSDGPEDFSSLVVALENLKMNGWLSFSDAQNLLITQIWIYLIVF